MKAQKSIFVLLITAVIALHIADRLWIVAVPLGLVALVAHLL